MALFFILLAAKTVGDRESFTEISGDSNSTDSPDFFREDQLQVRCS